MLGAEVVVGAVAGVEAVVVGAGRRRRHLGRGRGPAAANAAATSRGGAKPTGASRPGGY